MNMKKNKICIFAIQILSCAFTLFAAEMSFAQSPIVSCLAPPNSNLGTVIYDPNSPNDTLIDFQLSINPSNYSATQISDLKPRSIAIVKQAIGNESENLQFEFLNTSGGNLIGRNLERNLSDVSKLGYSGLSGPFDQVIAWQEIPDNTQGIANFRLRIPKGQFTQKSKTISYYVVGKWAELEGISNCPFESGLAQGQVLNFDLIVPSSMSINLAGALSIGHIDFGSINQMRENPKRNIAININSNSAFAISLESQNKGYMRNTTPGLEADKISYNVAVNGTQISENNPILYHSPTDGPISKDLEVTIIDSTNARPGIYKDIIFLRISPF